MTVCQYHVTYVKEICVIFQFFCDLLLFSLHCCLLQYSFLFVCLLFCIAVDVFFYIIKYILSINSPSDLQCSSHSLGLIANIAVVSLCTL